MGIIALRACALVARTLQNDDSRMTRLLRRWSGGTIHTLKGALGLPWVLKAQAAKALKSSASPSTRFSL
jgi:hypothetical protein